MAELRKSLFRRHAKTLARGAIETAYTNHRRDGGPRVELSLFDDGGRKHALVMTFAEFDRIASDVGRVRHFSVQDTTS